MKEKDLLWLIFTAFSVLGLIPLDQFYYGLIQSYLITLTGSISDDGNVTKLEFDTTLEAGRLVRQG